MNLRLYAGNFCAVSGYEDLFDWCLYLLDCARLQDTYVHTVNFSPITLTEDGDYYVGTTTVTLINCTGGYLLDRSNLPSDATISGYTGDTGDVLTIRIPKSYDSSAFTLTAAGDNYDCEDSGNAQCFHCTAEMARLCLHNFIFRRIEAV